MFTSRCSALFVVLGLVLAGCGQNGRSNIDSPAPTPRPVNKVNGPEAIAVNTVAEFLSIKSERVTVVSSEAQNFPDSSLGCPQPGMSYLQVITPGYRVVVEADGRRFDVRVAGTRGRICHKRKPAGDSDIEARVPELLSRARTDLAHRLALDVDAVQVSGVAAWQPGHDLPGCEPACAEGAMTCGYAISLIVDGRAYGYFASADSVIPCPPILPS